jgi:pimeloyl-ACP methyl ester carboxylesterase
VPVQVANGIRLYFEEHGEGQPILGVHGTSSSALMWSDAVVELEELGRVIVYDRRGCTRSERPVPYATSVAEQADDAAALLEALSATPAVVIGRSYGGGVAIDLTLRYPGHVRALVLLEADTPRRLSPEVSRWDEQLAARVEAAAAEGMDGVGRALLTAVVGEEAWEGFPDEVKEMFTDNGPAILAELRGGLLDVDPSALASIEQPTLLVAGTDSPDPFRRGTELMAAAIPNSRKVRSAVATSWIPPTLRC